MPVRCRVVVITGASGGVGRACAAAFARRGYDLVLAARRPESLERVARECRARSRVKALVVPTDMTDPVAVRHLASRAVESFGRIDVWVECAANAAFGRAEEVPLDVYRGVVELGTMGPVHSARAALPVMRRQNEGVFVLFSSVVAEAPVPFNSAYAVAKAASRAFGRSLRHELRLDGYRKIHVCTVLPATLDTPFFDQAGNYFGRAARAMPPLHSPERAARKVVSLARSPRPEAHVGSSATLLSLAMRLAPGPTGRALARRTRQKHFSRSPAPPSSGNVRAPAREAAVHGRWYGRTRTAARRLALTATATGALAALARARARHRRCGRGAGDALASSARTAGPDRH